MAENRVSEPMNAERNIPQKTAKICENMPYAAKEALKRMRTNLLISLGETTEIANNVIGITSAQPSEGKSTVSINLAYSMAELGKSVILLDCDLRRPSIHNHLGIGQNVGFSEVLRGESNLNDVLRRYQSTTNETYFDVIIAGKIPENPSELLSSKNFRQMLSVISDAYDVVILDLPPVNAVIDATVVAKLTDGLVVVVRENHCTRFVLQDCMQQLAHAKANILGFVVNGSVNGAGKRYHYGKGYRYDNAYYQYKK